MKLYGLDRSRSREVKMEGYFENVNNNLGLRNILEWLSDKRLRWVSLISIPLYMFLWQHLIKFFSHARLRLTGMRLAT
jgi:hypothetical protein